MEMHHQGHHLARSQPRCTAPFTLPAGELLAMPGGDKPLAKIVNITKQGYDILGVYWGGLLEVVGIPEHSIFLAQETPLLIQNSDENTAQESIFMRGCDSANHE
jgi:hypothetical protein